MFIVKPPTVQPTKPSTKLRNANRAIKEKPRPIRVAVVRPIRRASRMPQIIPAMGPPNNGAATDRDSIFRSEPISARKAGSSRMAKNNHQFTGPDDGDGLTGEDADGGSGRFWPQ